MFFEKKKEEITKNAAFGRLVSELIDRAKDNSIDVNVLKMARETSNDMVDTQIEIVKRTMEQKDV